MIFTIAGIVFALLVLGLIIVLLLRRQLREKYATLWLVIGLALLVLSAFPELLAFTAAVLGVEVPSNLLFALSIVLLVGVALHLSWELTRAEARIRRLSEEAAITRTEMDDLARAVRRLEEDSATDGEQGAPQRGGRKIQ
jgi:hypothetical protein